MSEIKKIDVGLFDFGTHVTLVAGNTEEYVYKGVITGILLKPEISTQYEVSWGDKSISYHYSVELIPEKVEA